MPFLVQACLDDHTLAVTTATAKEAFANAVEWHLTGRFTYVSISDSTKTYSIDAFALAMALLEIAKTVNAAALLGPKEGKTRPWTQADLVRLEKMVRQKASAADIAKSLGRRLGSVKAKVREMGLVPLKKSRAKIPDALPQKR